MEQNAGTFDHVRAVLMDPVYDAVLADVDRNGVRCFDEDTAFFAGSGGEKDLNTALRYAGWYGVTWRSPYHYVMQHDQASDVLTYTEGDVHRGDLITHPEKPMTKPIDHELTEIEIACGVTLAQVAELRPKGLFILEGTRFVLPADTAPALGTAVARFAFGALAEFAGLNQLGQPVYRQT